jgi:hypothetical protein
MTPSVVLFSMKLYHFALRINFLFVTDYNVTYSFYPLVMQEPLDPKLLGDR